MTDEEIKANEEIKAELGPRKVAYLKGIAKRLKVKNVSRVNKEQLITRLLQERTPKQIREVLSDSWWDRHRHHLYNWSKADLLAVAGLVLAIVLFFLSIPVTNSNKNKNELEISRTDQNVNGQPSPSPITQKTPEVTSPTPTPITIYAPAPTPRASALKETGKQTSLYLARAHSLYSQGKYQEALAFCNRALGLEPKNKEALNLRSNIERTIAILKNN